MSKKINQKLDKRIVPLSDREFSFIVALDAVGRSFDHYINELKTEYLKGITEDNGYKPDANLQVDIDLKDNKKQLIVTEVKGLQSS